MRRVLTHVTVGSGGEFHPPGSRLTLAADDAEALHKAGHVTLLDDEPETPEAPPVGDDDDGETDGETDETNGEPENRVAAIVEALDLLEEGDFFKSGKPKLTPLTDALGWKPTDEEIEAALQVRAEGV